MDIRLRKRGDTYLVQCKNWRKQRIGVPTVREMFGVLTAESATGVFIVCSGRFTADAVRFAEGKPITLVDGDKLMRMIVRVRRDSPDSRYEAHATKQQQDARIHLDAPSGPWCNGNLVVRTTKKGKNLGRRFWGCETFPKCRFMKDIQTPAS